ncbi:MAG: hypothetical protein J1F64_01675 [Oscillospiraceae bacterium]|nr:hypothetical protein [Oscillospiraceae bacterium]
MNKNPGILDEAERVIDRCIKKNRKKQAPAISFRSVFITLCTACAVSFALCILNLILWYTV